MTGTVLTFGHGYVADALAARMMPDGWAFMGTTRDPDRAKALQSRGIAPVDWAQDAVHRALDRATHVLVSVAPRGGGDPTLDAFGGLIAARAPHLHWVGYLSTTGVYGDHHGGWVDESTPLTPATERDAARVAAEAAWGTVPHLPLHIFRLPGIYGPGRSAFDRLRTGTAQRIVKPGQVFSRIHVDDIAQTLAASIAQPNPGAAYNVADDAPCAPQDVIAFAADLLGVEPPPEVPFEQANLSPMARSFYAESKRVRNDRITSELGVDLLCPTYREGLRAILSAETQANGSPTLDGVG
ncbi:SDR family oxidoreductase [Mesobacterium sp. TK19101]|uniref:SDR family oxidoreductase n=1 Tax=Mesobacterium hydrothermale TaxID=3111907 RepID=A0ABU6HM09_9RHOB|nr:SDR family oxidoreductase [Mesobacterium sp. TK19101]MEC3862896.1 SDR family oxidoreductase [Mesobacterium sp. TK19101]